MADVTVLISAPILYCDESILKLKLGNGYKLRKIHVDNLPYKDRITDGRGQLTIDYMGAALSDEEGDFFICLEKEEMFEVNGPIRYKKNSPIVFSDEDLLCQEQLEAHKEKENQYLYKTGSLLHLFKEGNVGPKDVFYEYRFPSLGVINNNISLTKSLIRNVVDSRVFSLRDDEIAECENFIKNCSDAEYNLLKNSIDEFVWGLEQADITLGFEQFITTLEMTLLAQNQQGKGESLSKRIAVMLGHTLEEKNNIYLEMKNLYKIRSEFLHEGNEQNITQIELRKLENIVRQTLNICLAFCKQEYAASPTVSWDIIKARLISNLKQEVGTITWNVVC